MGEGFLTIPNPFAESLILSLVDLERRRVVVLLVGRMCGAFQQLPAGRQIGELEIDVPFDPSMNPGQVDPLHPGQSWLSWWPVVAEWY